MREELKKCIYFALVLYADNTRKSHKISKSDINKLSIISRCGTVQDIVGFWADAQLTA
jgi:hypothetical protein